MVVMKQAGGKNEEALTLSEPIDKSLLFGGACSFELDAAVVQVLFHSVNCVCS